MSDLIDRQAAIEAAVEAADKWDGGYDYERQLIIEEALARIPSAERKKGKWINVNDGKWNTFEVLKCSVCGELDNRMDWTDNYCPNCGADMRGDTDE